MGSSRSQNYAQRRCGPFCCGNGLWSATVDIFFNFFPYDSPAAEAHVENLRRTVRALAPCRPSKSNTTSRSVPVDLKSCDHVFIREDAHKPPLTNPYRGPYLVLTRTNNSEDWISIDRLKPAYIDISNHNRDTVTRSGRTSRPPQRFDMSHPNRRGM